MDSTKPSLLYLEITSLLNGIIMTVSVLSSGTAQALALSNFVIPFVSLIHYTCLEKKRKGVMDLT